MGNFEEQAKEDLIKEILEITRNKLEELSAEELEEVEKALKENNIELLEE